MPEERSGGVSPTGIVLIVLACVAVGVIICAGVIIVCLVAITALGTSANATFGTVGTKIGDEPKLQAEQAGKQFVHDLCAGLTQSAWDQTTADFQGRHIKAGGPDQSKYFADILQEHPGLRNPSKIEVVAQTFDLNQESWKVTMTITPSRGEKITLNLKLKKELGLYKVNDLSVAEGEKDKDNGRKKHQ
jgi:hypothetical protein